jgi:recombination protein RecT
MSNAMSIIPIGEWSQQEVEVLKNTIAKDLTVPEFNFFMMMAQAMNLNPFLGQIHPVKYAGQLSVQVAYEGWKNKAETEDKGYQGVFNELICENDDFEAERLDNGQMKITCHKIKFPRGKVVGAYSIAKKEGKDDYVVIMDAEEVAHMTTGNTGAMWKKYFNDMFRKHVGKRAVKAQYNISGVEEDEGGTIGIESVSGYQPNQRIDITPEVSSTASAEPKKDDAASTIKAKWDEVYAKAVQLGMDNSTEEGKKKLVAYIQQRLKKKAKDCEIADLVGLLKIMDDEIEAAMTTQAEEEIDFDSELEEFEQESLQV